MFFGGALTVGGWWLMGFCRRSCIGTPEITSFSSPNLSRSNKHDTLSHDVSTGYFYISFLWVIAITDFRPLEIYKNLDLIPSTITFTVGSQADNHFYKYNCFKYYTVWNYFFIKIHIRVFYFQIWIKCETQQPFFSNNYGLQKTSI